MDADRFDGLTRVLARRNGRRVVVGGVAALLGAGVVRREAAAGPGDDRAAICAASRCDPDGFNCRCDREACAAAGGCCDRDSGACCTGTGNNCCRRGAWTHVDCLHGQDLGPPCSVRPNRRGVCGGVACFDLQTSRRHCGRCGHRCGAGRVCVEGRCRRRP